MHAPTPPPPPQVAPWVASISFPGADESGAFKTNQDYGCSMLNFLKRKDSALFCVMDGHGQFGHHVSHEVPKLPRAPAPCAPSLRAQPATLLAPPGARRPLIPCPLAPTPPPLSCVAQSLAVVVSELELNADSLLASPSRTMSDVFDVTQSHLKAHLTAGKEAAVDAGGFVDSSQSGSCALVVYARGDAATGRVRLARHARRYGCMWRDEDEARVVVEVADLAEAGLGLREGRSRKRFGL